jgi:hypothetical protein
MVIYNCLFCNSEGLRPSWSPKKYCSLKCQNAYQNKQRIDEWKRTQKIESKNTQIPPWLKRYILEKQDGKCLCGISEWNGKPLVLELEHKDGNSDNNTEENLCCLCPNCHSQTASYKGANRGKGRHARRERYKMGKSF